MVSLIHYFKLTDLAGAIEERIAWEVPKNAKNPDGIRYRLVYIKKGQERPTVLYDNHHPKGHHKHIGDREFPYEFKGFERLLADFAQDLEELRWTH